MKLQILTVTISYKIDKDLPKTIIDPMELERYREDIKKELKKQGFEKPDVTFTTTQIPD